jgi:hypothetical protein
VVDKDVLGEVVTEILWEAEDDPLLVIVGVAVKLAVEVMLLEAVPETLPLVEEDIVILGELLPLVEDETLAVVELLEDGV